MVNPNDPRAMKSVERKLRDHFSAVDVFDMERAWKCFTDDGSIDCAEPLEDTRAVFVGRDECFQFWHEMRERVSNVHHRVERIAVHVEGDSAVALINLVFHGETAGGPPIVAPLVYAISLRKEGRSWRIHRMLVRLQE